MTLGSTCDSPMAAFHKFHTVSFPTRGTVGSAGLYESYGPSGKAIDTTAWTCAGHVLAPGLTQSWQPYGSLSKWAE